MKSVCVFCGSRVGNNQKYTKTAIDLAHVLVENNLELVYGGGKVGLMGILADEVKKLHGKVTGIIPEFLYQKEVGHEGLDQLIIVDSMHTRKQKMSELSDGFIAMPGGFGTLEEFAEIITWNQLNLVHKPVGLLNCDKFYNSLLDYFDYMVEEGFVDLNFRETIFSSENPDKLINSFFKHHSESLDQNLSKT